MGLNQPTVTTNRISFGPALVYLGASGSTPTVEVGAIRTDDGVNLEISVESRDILQGNAKTIEYSFAQAHGLMCKFTSIEWDWTRLAWALGSGVTTSGGGSDTFSWGGDPLLTTLAIHIQHQMPVSGNTLNVYVWKAVTETPPSLPFGHDEHAFELSFKAQRAATDWNGASLAYTSQLVQFDEVT